MGRKTSLVDLIATQEPETTAKGETVVVTAPVIVAGRPDAPGQVRLTLTIEQAEYLAAQIQPVLRIARGNARQKR